ncbi:zinc finger protein 860-like [Palaemon carinicauda]|uniref:zinc finger protein 860-like n=1 Tax=Palaemon carinicauda TaxID=392227 RepID=UPI0035B68014
MFSFRDLVESMENGRSGTKNINIGSKLKTERDDEALSEEIFSVKEETDEENDTAHNADLISDTDSTQKYFNDDNSTDKGSVNQPMLKSLQFQGSKPSISFTNEKMLNGFERNHDPKLLPFLNCSRDFGREKSHLDYRKVLNANPIYGNHDLSSSGPSEHTDKHTLRNKSIKEHQAIEHTKISEKMLIKNSKMVIRTSSNLSKKFTTNGDTRAPKIDSKTRITSNIGRTTTMRGDNNYINNSEAYNRNPKNSEIGGNNLTENTEIIRCDFCDATFRSKNQLEGHNKVHSPIRPFECPECPRRFNQLSHLNIHRRTHSGERPFQCETCGARFSRKDRLRSHLRIHTGEKPYACPRCSSLFKYSWDLKDHLKTKHSDHGLFQCRVCHVSFANLTTFTSHWETHK